MVSPLLWKRWHEVCLPDVQSVAVKLLEREREIKAFQPEEYWQIAVETKCEAAVIAFEVTYYQFKPLQIKINVRCRQSNGNLKNSRYIVTEVETKPTQSRAKPLYYFNIATDRQSSFRVWCEENHVVMYNVYTKPVIILPICVPTSTNLSQDALTMVRAYISDNFSAAYLPEKPNFY